MSGVHRRGAATNKNGVRNRPLQSGGGLQDCQQVRVLACKVLKLKWRWRSVLLLAESSIAFAWLITHPSILSLVITNSRCPDNLGARAGAWHPGLRGSEAVSYTHLTLPTILRV